MKVDNLGAVQAHYLHYCCKKEPEELTHFQKNMDTKLMQICLDQLSGPMDKSSDVPIAALMYNESTGEMIGAVNSTIQATDPSAHAEINVLRQASQKCKNHRLSQWTIYVTLEPCLMCFGALLEARVKRIVFAAADSKVGILSKGNYQSFHHLGNHHFSWTQGVLAGQASQKLKGFFQKHCR
ncbi:MAG: nucleoside deaminase [Pseudomonadota bacterium]|nr:nucleoside deaminase [Pseudomonadota bacterium]